MSDTNGRMAAYLAEHPRMIGALFTILMLLSQVGGVVANKNSTIG